MNSGLPLPIWTYHPGKPPDMIILGLLAIPVGIGIIFGIFAGLFAIAGMIGELFNL